MKGIAYLVQATLVFLWWITLSLSDSFYDAFQFPGLGKMAFNSFLLPDILLIGILSIITAYKRLAYIDHIILGAFAFATLYCINASILSGGGYLSTLIMTLGLSYNIFLVFNKKMFKTAAPNSILWNGVKTFIQIMCVWCITLFIIPALIIDTFSLSATDSQILTVCSLILFILFSGIGLLSAYHMVTRGNGTPLPVNQTNNLVTSGPYKYVRNPMAVAGIGQGISISILYNSYHIACYALLGAILWQLVVKPLEEADMLRRFGDEYALYQSRVSCWLPKIN